MKLLVCGSRTFIDETVVWPILDGIWQDQNIGWMLVHVDPFVLIEGGARGADRCAQNWAKQSPLHSYGERPDDQPFLLQTIEADWTTHGKAAGPIRNQLMLEQAPDLVVAFVDKPLADSRGTCDMVTRARAAGVRTWVIEVRC